MTFQSPLTVPCASDPFTMPCASDPTIAEMERLQRHLDALLLTHSHLTARLEEARAGAEAVTKKLMPGKRELVCGAPLPAKGRVRGGDDDDDDDDDDYDCIARAIRMHAVIEPAVVATDEEEGERKKRSTCSRSTRSSVSTDTEVTDEEPLYRECRNGFSTPTTGDEPTTGEEVDVGRSHRGDAALNFAPAADDEFDDDWIDADGPPETYRSCALGPEDSADLEAAALAAVDAHERVSDAVAAVGALAEPGVMGLLPSDCAVEEQLDKLLAAMRALLR